MSDRFKLGLYLETTTFNWYFDERKGHDDVVRLFEAVKAGEFAGYTSRFVADELKQASEPKRTDMMNLIDDYGIIVLPTHPKAASLAQAYRDAGIIPQSQAYDSLHIATASLYEIEAVVSYNFHHINRNKVKTLIPDINAAWDLGGILFFTAEEVFNYAGLL